MSVRESWMPSEEEVAMSLPLEKLTGMEVRQIDRLIRLTGLRAQADKVATLADRWMNDQAWATELEKLNDAVDAAARGGLGGDGEKK